MFKKCFFFFLLFLAFSDGTCAQNTIEHFLTSSDSLNAKRKNGLFIAEASAGTAALIGLNQLWYADYPRSNFHFINDNADWLQMDKVGHFYATYHIGRFGAEMLQWTGATKKQQLLYGK